MSSVEKEEYDLCCGVHMIVVLELCIQKQLIPVVLPFAAEDPEVLF